MAPQGKTRACYQWVEPWLYNVQNWLWVSLLCWITFFLWWGQLCLSETAKSQYIKKINPFSVFLMADPPSLLLSSPRVISRGHVRVSKQARFWCNCYHGLSLFWMNSHQSCGRAHPCRALAETEFPPYFIALLNNCNFWQAKPFPL